MNNLFNDLSYDLSKYLTRNELTVLTEINTDSLFTGLNNMKYNRYMPFLENAKIHLVSIPGEDPFPNGLEKQVPSLELLEELYPGITKSLERGDMIEDLSITCFRAQGVYFYDGVKIIDKNFYIHDFGSIPLEFKIIKEFPPNYWDNPIVIDHTNTDSKSQLRWYGVSLPLPFDVELIRNLDVTNIGDKSYIIIKNKYLLFFEGDLNKEDYIENGNENFYDDEIYHIVYRLNDDIEEFEYDEDERRIADEYGINYVFVTNNLRI